MIALLDHLLRSWSVVVPVVLSVLEVGGLVSAWHAINKVRTPQGAVAWAVGLLALPILVLPLYWVFGRNRFAGYREAIRLVEQHHADSVNAVRRALFTDFNAGDPTALSPLARLADILDTPMSYGNQFELLVDDQLVLIGSTNLDNRSLHLNFELMLAADEPKLIRQVTEMLEQDFANSVRKDPGKNRLLPWYVRIGTVLARLFSPVL